MLQSPPKGFNDHSLQPTTDVPIMGPDFNGASTKVDGNGLNFTQKDLIESNLQLIQKIGGKRAANLNSVEALNDKKPFNSIEPMNSRLPLG